MPDACPVNAQASTTPEEIRVAEEFAPDESEALALEGAAHETCVHASAEEEEACFVASEIGVAEAIVALWGTEAPRRCREVSASSKGEEGADAKVVEASRAAYLRYAGYAEKILAEAGMLA
jgi:hypothetical protein